MSAAHYTEYLRNCSWLVARGGVISITALAFNFTGELRDALDPKT